MNVHVPQNMNLSETVILNQFDERFHVSLLPISYKKPIRRMSVWLAGRFEVTSSRYIGLINYKCFL